jgi:hypothetical protein
VRDLERLIGVAAQQPERPAPRRLGDELGAEVGRSDGVRLGHGRSAAILVTADCECQAKSEDEADDSEQRALQHAEGLAQLRLVLAEIAPEREAGGRRGSDDRQKEERDRPARDREEHRPGYVKAFTARATISPKSASATVDCTSIVYFARYVSGITSVGLKAVAFVKPRWR